MKIMKNLEKIQEEIDEINGADEYPLIIQFGFSRGYDKMDDDLLKNTYGKIYDRCETALKAAKEMAVELEKRCLLESGEE